MEVTESVRGSTNNMKLQELNWKFTNVKQNVDLAAG